MKEIWNLQKKEYDSRTPLISHTHNLDEFEVPEGLRRYGASLSSTHPHWQRHVIGAERLSRVKHTRPISFSVHLLRLNKKTPFL